MNAENFNQRKGDVSSSHPSSQHKIPPVVKADDSNQEGVNRHSESILESLEGHRPSMETESVSLLAKSDIISNSNSSNDNDVIGGDDYEKYISQEPFPLLKYSRITGSLPRSTSSSSDNPTESKSSSSSSSSTGMLTVPCLCTSLGKLVLVQTNTSTSSSSQSKNRDLNGIEHGGIQEFSILGDGSSIMNSSGISGGGGSLLVSGVPQVYYILALGMSDGSIHLINPRNGKSFCPSTCLKIISSHPSSTPPLPTKSENISQTPSSSESKGDSTPSRKKLCAVVDVSFDASGSFLAAITQGGDVSIFEFRFGKGSLQASNANDMMSHGKGAMTSNISSEGISTKQPVNMFESFLSKLAGDDRTPHTSEKSIPKSSLHQQGSSTDVVIHSLCTARFHYHKPMQSQSASSPTCLAIDPSYRRRKEKAIIVGFEDGRLILTKRSSHGGASEAIVTGTVGATVINTSGAGIGGAMSLFLQPRRRDIELYYGMARESNTGGPKGIEALTWRGNLIAWADSSGIKLFNVEHMTRIAHIDRPSGAKVELYPTISSIRPCLVFERCDSLLIVWGDCLMSMSIKYESESGADSHSINDGNEKITSTSKGPSYKVDCIMAWQMDCIACDVSPLDSDHVVVLGLVPLAPGSGEIDEVLVSNLVELQIISRSTRSLISCDCLPLLRDTMVMKGSESEIHVDNASMFSLQSSFCTPRQEDTVEALDELWMNIDTDGADVTSMMQNSIIKPLVETVSTITKVSAFVDPHMRWSINEVRRLDYDENTEEKKEDESSESSIEYSDDYSFIFQNQSMLTFDFAMKTQGYPPLLMIQTQSDSILVETRDIDDAISFARSKGLHGTALRRGLVYRKYLRRHTLRLLVDEYLSALLYPSDKSNKDDSDFFEKYQRLHLAARSAAVLIGGEIDPWIRWTFEFAKVPGGLFVLRPFFPVRDPRLPSLLYEFILDKLFIDTVSLIRQKETVNLKAILPTVVVSAADLFINALYGWGPTTCLNARIHFLNYEPSESGRETLRQADEDLHRRYSQRVSTFLDSIISSTTQHVISTNKHGIALHSLFDIENVENQLHYHLRAVNSFSTHSSLQDFLSLYFQAMSSLALMRNSYEDSIKWLLYMYSYDQTRVASIEDESSRAIHDADFYSIGKPLKYNKFAYVADLIETHQLHRLLIDPSSFMKNITFIDFPLVLSEPLHALICLLGLDRSGDFLTENCTGVSTHKSSTIGMPIDEVADKLKPTPKILCWFLNLMLYRKPEYYIAFTNTSIPPSSIVELHRCHFELLVEFTDTQSQNVNKRKDIPRYDDVHLETPLLYLVKKSIPMGGVTAIDAMNKLTMKREPIDATPTKDSHYYPSAQVSDVKYPFLFARELAYLLECNGPPSEEVSKTVLSLYLDGASSLPLAVAYAERNTQYSNILWTNLVSYSLNVNIFGTLLEVAARYGANLAYLVSRIPKGLQVEGIRPKLVSAIQDYQLKVKIHDGVKTVIYEDKIQLMRDLHYTTRRAKRIEFQSEFKTKHLGDKESPEICGVVRKSKRYQALVLPIR